MFTETAEQLMPKKIRIMKGAIWKPQLPVRPSDKYLDKKQLSSSEASECSTFYLFGSNKRK